jgi:hypothetical protein
MAIYEFPHAELLEVAVNEGAMDQKQEGTTGQPTLDDPIAWRFGAWANPLGRLKYYIAKISLDVLRWKDGRKHRTEVGFLKMAVDELFDGDGRPMPMLGAYLTTNDHSSNDADQQAVFLITRGGLRIMVPVYLEGGIAGIGNPPPPRITRFYSDGGKFCVNVQDDQDPVLRFVKYRCLPNDQHPHINPLDEATWVPMGESVL